jgi:trans-2-enoyl-CoA reductase
VLSILALPVAAAEHDERIDVTVRGIVKSGVMAIGAETTGVTITANGVTWDLELQGKQANTAAELDGRMAVVAGQLARKRGVERAERYVVKVKSIKAAKP